jgi:hypothetical protein
LHLRVESKQNRSAQFGEKAIQQVHDIIGEMRFHKGCEVAHVTHKDRQGKFLPRVGWDCLNLQVRHVSADTHEALERDIA